MIFWKLTNEDVSSTKQEVRREEGDPVEGDGLQPDGASAQVKDEDQRTAQAEVGRATVDDDPVMALGRGNTHELTATPQLLLTLALSVC